MKHMVLPGPGSDFPESVKVTSLVGLGQSDFARLIIFNDTIEGLMAPAVKPGRVDHIALDTHHRDGLAPWGAWPGESAVT